MHLGKLAYAASGLLKRAGQPRVCPSCGSDEARLAEKYGIACVCK